MPRVICELDNASDEISGVKFSPLEDGGMISEDISQEQADMFARIPGYVIDGAEPAKAEPEPTPAPRKNAKKAAEPVVEPAAEPEQPAGGEIF